MRNIFLILLLFPLITIAQVKPKVDKKYYVDENGKIYWYGKKPVYIFVADNPEGQNLHRLQSEAHPKYTNPFYLDTEGINYIRTNWAADSTLTQVQPKFELLFEMYRDSYAPSTKVDLANAPKYKDANGKTFYGKGLQLITQASDNQSGVQNTFVSLDNANFGIFNGQQDLATDKEFDVKIYSADNTGNVEPIQMYQFRVDLTSPVSEYTIHGDQSGMVFSSRTQLKMTSVDVTSGVNRIAYKIDEGQELIFSDKISLASLKDGSHKISYYAYDNVANKEEPKTIEFYLDSTEPTVESTIVGDQYQNRGRVFISTRTKVKLVAEDNKSGVKTIKYAVDGGEPKVYFEPFPLDRSHGNHVITYFAIDKVNNQFNGKLEESNLTRSSLDIDMIAPEISYAYKGKQYVSRDTAFVTSNSEISLSALDAESGVKDIGYKINGATGQAYTGPIKMEEEGMYTIDFYGTDQVNNRNTKSFFFVVDNTGPEIENILSMEPIGKILLDENKGQPINVYSIGVRLYLGATDKVIDTDKIYYTLNGAAELEYTKPITLSTKGMVTYQIRALDKLGNVSTSEKIVVFLK